MFGYVMPCKMELKIKDYEKFKAYYCGLCRTIKQTYGNIPRLVLNYDMTFAAILLDSIGNKKTLYKPIRCVIHPVKKRIITEKNNALEYAAFLNISLSYYKFLDNITDDNSRKSKVAAFYLKTIVKKFPKNYDTIRIEIEKKLNSFYANEKNTEILSIDELCDPFCDLLGFILDAFCYENSDFDSNSYENTPKSNLYYFGYNLGKWIYIIDAFNDLKKDMKSNSFNAIDSTMNKNRLPYEKLQKNISERIEFLLTTCARMCLEYLEKIKLFKNQDLLKNIIELGLLEKMDTVFKRNCEIS